MFYEPIKQLENLIVPTICVYELSKVILRESDEHHLLQALAIVQKGKIVNLSSTIAPVAAKISLQHKLPMADSIIYATALQNNATVWTQDADFKDLPHVRYFPKL